MRAQRFCGSSRTGVLMERMQGVPPGQVTICQGGDVVPAWHPRAVTSTKRPPPCRNVALNPLRCTQYLLQKTSEVLTGSNPDVLVRPLMGSPRAVVLIQEVTQCLRRMKILPDFVIGSGVHGAAFSVLLVQALSEIGSDSQLMSSPHSDDQALLGKRVAIALPILTPEHVSGIREMSTVLSRAGAPRIGIVTLVEYGPTGLDPLVTSLLDIDLTRGRL